MKDIIAIGTVLLLMLNSVLAKPLLKIEHVGYSDREAVFSLKNAGDTNIANIDLFLDGEKYKTINALLAPNRAIQFYVSVDPGQHELKACYQDVCDSVNFVMGTKTESVEQEEKSFLERNKSLLVAVIVVLLILTVIWILKKPKL